jgi:DNA processing protein
MSMYQLSSAWTALALASGRVDPWPVLETLGGVDALEAAGRGELSAAGLPLDVVASMLAGPCTNSPVPFVLAGQPAYPEALTALPFAPPVIFYEGELGLLGAPAVAIVGARRCTAEGRQTAADIARAVCLAGGVVVSGMAIGIDTAAHKAALECGRTAAVLGQGLAAWHSRGAWRQREEIVRGGGVVLSEFLPHLGPRRFTFLQRNRVIAGTSRATVVVEAGLRSGALSTARHALEAGREVLAVPGHYRAPASAGCLALIEQGAVVVRSPATVVEAAGLLQARGAEGPRPLPDAARILDDALQRGGTLEQLAGRAGIPVVQASAILVELELAGLVRRLPGQRYERSPAAG